MTVWFFQEYFTLGLLYTRLYGNTEYDLCSQNIIQVNYQTKGPGHSLIKPVLFTWLLRTIKKQNGKYIQYMSIFQILAICTSK